MCERWVHDPYFQYFTGEEFFQHAFPHERSDLNRWRKRLGDKLELLLAESLRVAHSAGALRSQDLKRVTVDTTVQPKAITFPTDTKLLHAAIKGLNHLARKHGVKLRQSFCSRRQDRGDDGFPLRPCQAIQAASAAVAHPALPTGAGSSTIYAARSKVRLGRRKRKDRSPLSNDGAVQHGAVPKIGEIHYLCGAIMVVRGPGNEANGGSSCKDR